MKKILIVDDSEFMRKVLKDYLINKIDGVSLAEEVEIYEADGRINALKLFKKNKPDVILLDVVMKDSPTEGLEFLEEIKNEFDTKRIIMLSSIGQTSVMEACKQFGIISYLHKPFDPDLVIEAINRALH